MSNPLEDAAMALRSIEGGAERESPVRSRLMLTCARDVEPVAVDWLWSGWLPFGKLSSIVGAAGIGKSTLVTDLIARATRGGPMPGEAARFEPIAVLVAGVEDGWADTIRPRLDAATADLSRVHFVSAPSSDVLTVPRDVSGLRLAAQKTGARWLHIDSIMGTLGDDVNAYRDHEVRRALNPLKDLAEELGLVVTYISHPRKEGGSAVNAGGGSVAFGALARVLLFAGFDPNDTNTDPNERRRVFAVGKNNLARTPPSRSFQVVTGGNGIAGCIAWGDASAVSAEDLSQPTVLTNKPRRERTDHPHSSAESFIEDVLANGVRLKVDEVKAQARTRALKWRTVERAAGDIGVTKERTGWGGGSVWYFAAPAEATDDANLIPAIPATPPCIANDGGNGGNESASSRERLYAVKESSQNQPGTHASTDETRSGGASVRSSLSPFREPMYSWAVCRRLGGDQAGQVVALDAAAARAAAERAGFGLASHRVQRLGPCEPATR